VDKKLWERKYGIKHVRRNFYLNVFDGAIFAFAMAVVAQNTVFPVFIKSIGGGSIAIGLIPVFWTIGFNFPQILIANFAGKIPYKKNLLLLTCFFQRLFWLGLGLVTFYLLPKLSIELSVILVFFFFTLAAIGGGLNFPGWFDLISKITPVNLRGRLFAWRVSIGALLGVLGGYTVKYVLSEYSYPNNYALLILLAFLITMISYALLFFIKEEKPSKPENKSSFKEYLKYLPAILRENKNFKNFLIADVTMIVAFTSFAFFTVDAIEKFSLPDSSAGIFTMIVMLSMIIGSLVFGHIADVYGHKINLVFISLFTLIACLLAVLSVNIYMYYFVFVFSAIATALLQISRITIVAEMCGEKDRAIYVALTNIITVPFILTGILAGWVAYLFDYNLVFSICAVISAVALFWYLKMVEEPRGKKSFDKINLNRVEL